MTIDSTRRLVACAAALLSPGCSAPVEVAELPGTYVFSIKADTLHLEASGLYRRVFVRNELDGGVSVDTGRSHEADTLRRGVLALEIKRTWKRELTLEAHSEFGWRYARLDSGLAAAAEAR